MVDNLKPEDRRRAMQRVKGKNTTPELAVRSLVHRLGYRFRLHRRDLPGTPDLVFPARKTVMFVHGCWWHMHRCRAGQKCAKTNVAYWTAKRERNRKRDRRVQRELRQQGWRVLTVWECQLRNPDRLARRIIAFLG